jgi:hypothetical protein
MSKYDPLATYLREQNRDAISLTFREVSRIVGHALPASARYPAWWSNNSSNSVMTKVWLAAGFKTEKVDIAGEKLVFRRQRTSAAEDQREFRSAPVSGRHPIFGALRGTLKVTVDLTLPADPDWGSQ